MYFNFSKLCLVVAVIIVGTLLYPQSSFAVDEIQHQVSRVGSFKVEVKASLTKEEDKPEYKAGDKVSLNVLLNNIGQYCLGQGELTYDLVKGSKEPVLNRFVNVDTVDNENIISQQTLNVNSCPGNKTTVPISFDLPSDLSGGQYRIDIYLNSQRVPINGNQVTYSPLVYLPFTVKGGGSFPGVKIVRSRTRFAGGAFQVGPVIVPSDKQSGFVTIQNDGDRQFTGKLKTKFCTFDEVSGLGCLESNSYQVSVGSKSSKEIEIELSTKIKPDVYSLNYQLVDNSGRLFSQFQNRFIVRGRQASLQYLAVDKNTYKKGDVVSIGGVVNGLYTYSALSGKVKNVDFKVDFYDNSGFLEKKIFSKDNNYAVISSDSDAEFRESFRVVSDINSYKICGEVSVDGVIVEYRCTTSSVTATHVSVPRQYVFVVFLLGVLILLFTKTHRKKSVISFLIVFSGVSISLFILMGSGKSVLAERIIVKYNSTFEKNNFKLHNPKGPDSIPTYDDGSIIGGPDCAFANFYFDKNNDGAPQKGEQINIFQGKDDGRYYLPKGTIVYLFRPMYDDPSTNDCPNSSGKHCLNTTPNPPIAGFIADPSPYNKCTVDLHSVHACVNGSLFETEYWPIYVMDITKGGHYNYTASSNNVVNITSAALLAAVNANTHSTLDFTSTTNLTTIYPPLTVADIPSLVDVNSPTNGNLVLLDSYLGLDGTVNPPPYPPGQIFQNYQTRCQAANQTLGPSSTRFALEEHRTPSFNIASAYSVNLPSLPLVSFLSSFLNSINSAFNFSFIDRSKLLAALPQASCITTGVIPGVYSGTLSSSSCAAANRTGAKANYYQYAVNLGDLVTVSATSSVIDAYINLLDANSGSILFSNDLFSPSVGINDAKIVYIATTTTNHVVEATSYYQNSTGSLGFRLQKSPITAIIPGAYYNQLLSSDLSSTRGNYAYLANHYSFSANAGDLFTITATSTSAFYPYLYLISSNGATVLASNSYYSGYTTAKIVSYLIPSAGNYYIEVSPSSLQTQTGNFNLILEKVAPTTPTALVVGGGDGQLTASWNTSPGATDYVVYRSAANGAASFATSTATKISVSASPYLDQNTGLVNGSTYCYKVSAVNAVGESLASATGVCGTPASLPGRPNIVSVTPGDGSLTVAWSAPTTGGAVSNYELYSKTDPSVSSTTYGVWVVKDGSASILSFNNSGLNANNTYYYVVTAKNTTGYSQDSTPVMSGIPKPLAPTSITVGVGDGKAMLSWPASTGATSYKAYYSASYIGPYNSPSGTVSVTYPTVTSSVVSGLTNSTEYCFKISALNVSGESAQSTYIQCGTPVAVPVAPIISGIVINGNGSLTIKWSAVANAQYYKVYRQLNNSDFSSVVPSAGWSYCCSNTDYYSTVVSGSTYSYAISASNAAGVSSLSNVVSATPVPQPPASLTLTTGDDSQLGISWPASTGATDYLIYRGNTTTVSSTTGTLVGAQATTSRSIIDTGLVNGTLYYYVGYARNVSGGSSLPTTVYSAKPVLSPPQAPTALVGASGDAKAYLIWTAPARAATSYKIYFATPYNYSTYNTVLSTNVIFPTATSSIISGLTNTVNYWFKVSALNAAGEGPQSTYSNYVQPIVPVPGDPTNLNASPGNKSAYLYWSPPISPNPVTGYRVYVRDPVTGNYYKFGNDILVTAIPTVASPLLITGLTNGATYWFKVSSYYVGSNSTSESYGLGTTNYIIPKIPVPNTPTNLAAVAGNAQVALTWTAPSGQFDGYHLYRSTSDMSAGVPTNGTANVFYLASTTTSFNNISTPYVSIVNKTTYYYRIAAYNSTGDSVLSNQVTARPLYTCVVSPPLTDQSFISGAETDINVNGKNYYIDLDGVRGWLWSYGYIYGQDQIGVNWSNEATVLAKNVLIYKVKDSGVYQILIHKDMGYEKSIFAPSGSSEAPASVDAQFKDRRVQ